MRSLSILADKVFADGCSFLLPYLGLYLGATFLGGAPSAWLPFFVALHFFFLALWIFYLVQKRPSGALGWLALFAVLWWPGAYLEYPSDPWIHASRLFSFGHIEDLARSPFKTSFVYYWGWTILDWVPSFFRRSALDLYSAFWQWLVAFQLFLFVKRLGEKGVWPWVHLLAFFCFFGTNLFSYRYYALSASPIAYVFYLASVGALLKGPMNVRRVLWMGLALIMIGFNHRQELMLWMISAGVLGLLFFWKPPSSKWNIGLGLLWGVALIGGLAFYQLPLARELFSHFEPGVITPLSTLNPLAHRQVIETLGGHGFLALIGAVLLFPRYRLIAMLALAPFLLLLFPPAVIALSAVLPSEYIFYRVLFAFPLSIVAVIGLRELFQRAWFSPSPKAVVASVILFIVGLGLPATYPWRGRLFFQFYQPPDELALKDVDLAASWLATYRKSDHHCWYLTDAPTEYALSALWGTRRKGSRITPNYGTDAIHLVNLAYKFRSEDAPCGFFVRWPGKSTVAGSRIGHRSGHWPKTYFRGHLSLNDRLLERLPTLYHDHQWTVTPVPPHFLLYEPPWKRWQFSGRYARSFGLAGTGQATNR